MFSFSESPDFHDHSFQLQMKDVPNHLSEHKLSKRIQETHWWVGVIRWVCEGGRGWDWVMGWVGLGRWVGGYVVGAFSCELENDKVIVFSMIIFS